MESQRKRCVHKNSDTVAVMTFRVENLCWMGDEFWEAVSLRISKVDSRLEAGLANLVLTTLFAREVSNHCAAHEPRFCVAFIMHAVSQSTTNLHLSILPLDSLLPSPR